MGYEPTVFASRYIIYWTRRWEKPDGTKSKARFTATRAAVLGGRCPSAPDSGADPWLGQEEEQAFQADRRTGKGRVLAQTHPLSFLSPKFPASRAKKCGEQTAHGLKHKAFLQKLSWTVGWLGVMRPLRGPSRVEVGQGDPDAAHGRRAEKGSHAGPRGPRASSAHPTGCWFPQRCEAQPNRTATSCQSQGLREDGAEGRGGLAEFAHMPWSTGKTKLTSSGRSEQRGSNTKARKVSCHRRKTRKSGRREERMFRNAPKRPHRSPDVCSQTEKTTDARGSRQGGAGPAGQDIQERRLPELGF